jgi:acetyl-CoA acetyltransferase
VRAELLEWVAPPAAGWIATGQAQAVLCVFGDMALSASRNVTGFGSVPAMAMEEMEKAYGAFAAPINYAQLAQRYLHCHGYTEEALGAVALFEREHAALYPPAIRKDPLTMTDYLASRPIASPLKTLDCAIINDGASAFIVADRSVARNTRRPEIAILGIGRLHHPLAAVADA